MRLFILGATGRVGSVILENAVSEGIEVNALVRHPNRLKTQGIQYVQGDVLNFMKISHSMKGTDAVISALGTDSQSVLSKSTPLLIKAMHENGIKRIVTIGTAGILQSRTNPTLYRFQSADSKRKSTIAAEDHLNAYHQLKESGLEWTIVCPTYLPLGERKGNYRTEVSFLPDNGTSISVFDTADFAYAQLFSNDYICERVGIAY